MFAYFLCLAVAQAPSNPSSIHPSEPLFALELPDVSGSLDAYERAPLITMVRDPEVRATVEKLEKALGFDLAAGLETLLAAIGDKIDAMPRDLETLLARARKLRSFSLSLSIHEETPGELRGLLARLAETQAEILDLTELVEAALRTNAAAPTKLADLSTDERLKTDAWGRPYEFDVNGSQEFSVVSLGADGARGGVGAAADIDANFDRAMWLAFEIKNRWCALANIELESPESARDTIELLEAALSTGIDAEPRQIRVQGADAELRTIRGGEMFGADGWLMLRANTVILGRGRVQIDDVIKRIEGSSPSFATSALMSKLAREGGSPTGRVLMRGMISTRALSELTDELPGTELAGSALSMLSNSSITFAGRMQIAGDRFITDVVSPTSADSWFSALADRAVTDPVLAFIPGDAAGALVAQIDGAELQRRFMQLLGIRARETGADAAGDFAALELENDFNLRRDVFDNLAGGMSMHVMPLSTLGVPNIVIALELKDAVAFEKGIHGLAKSLEQQTEGRVKVRPSKYKGSPTWELKFDETEPTLFTVSPTVTIIGSRVVMTSTLLFARREIKRALGGEPATAHPLSSRKGVPPNATVIGSMDWGSLIGSIYKAGRGTMALAGGMLNLPIDTAQISAALPENPATFTRFFQPTMLWGRPVEGAFHLHWEASFGPETWLGIAGLGAAAFQSFTTVVEHSAVEANDGAETGNATERETTLTSLDLLSTRLVVFQLDQGRFPNALNELTTPTENYPQGFLDGPSVPDDGWGRAFGYRALDDGVSFQLWSFGPDGVDAAGAGDDIVAK